MKLLFLGLTLFLLGAASGCATQRPESVSKRDRKIVGVLLLDPSVPFPKNKTVGAAWLAYLVARTGYIADHEDAYMSRIDRTEPLFAEEVSARSAAAEFWLNYPAKGDAYLDQVVLVLKAGFMPQYVWTNFRQPDWDVSEAPGNLDGFQTWAAAHLPNHVPETYGAVRVSLPRR